MERITEQDSPYRHLEKLSTRDLLKYINLEDQRVAVAVAGQMDAIEALAHAVFGRMKEGGRLFYLGAGTSGRIAVLDAAECPPTFGIPYDWVIGLIAGGDTAIRRAVEFAEDDQEQAWKDLSGYDADERDFVLGVSASGTTPYVLQGLAACRRKGITTGCVCCNPGSPISGFSDFPVEVIVGPEFVTGSTRMKAGTAQKMVLNMLTTSVMIKLGRVEDNKMVDMRLHNHKLFERGVRMLMDKLDLTDPEEARNLLLRHQSVRDAVRKYRR